MLKPSFALPPLYRDSQRLLRLIEVAVMRFPRYHKYAIGLDLRRGAMAVMRAMHHAIGEKNITRIDAMMVAIEDLTLTLQLAQELKAFHSIKQFEEIAELAINMSKQCGGWQRSTRKRDAMLPAHSTESSSPNNGQ